MNEIIIPKRLKTGMLFIGLTIKQITIIAINFAIFILPTFLITQSFKLKLYIIPFLLFCLSLLKVNDKPYIQLIFQAIRVKPKTMFQNENNIKYDDVINENNYQIGIQFPQYTYSKKTKELKIIKYLTLDIYDQEGRRLFKNIKISTNDIKKIKRKKVIFNYSKIPINYNDKEIINLKNYSCRGIFVRKEKND